MRTIMALTSAMLLGAVAGKLGASIGGSPAAILFSIPASFVGFYYGRRWFDDHLGD